MKLEQFPKALQKIIIAIISFVAPSRVSQFDKVILKKHLVLGTFLSFSVKVNNNFISDLLRYQSKN
uniref:hypothetical protein n=1 Tax=Mesomycoplasma ovipneumoniae TaxID=29562 RepID=UPI003080CDF8